MLHGLVNYTSQTQVEAEDKQPPLMMRGLNCLTGKRGSLKLS